MELHAVRTWYDQRHGVVELDDDVQNVVRQVHEIDPRIHVFYNEQTNGYDLVEHCLDETHRLIFSVGELDARVLDRLRAGDSWKGGNPNHPVDAAEDFLTKIEDAQDRERAEVDEAQLERIRDAGERLAWALEEDGKGVHASISVSKEVS